MGTRRGTATVGMVVPAVVVPEVGVGSAKDTTALVEVRRDLVAMEWGLLAVAKGLAAAAMAEVATLEDRMVGLAVCKEVVVDVVVETKVPVTEMARREAKGQQAATQAMEPQEEVVEPVGRGKSRNLYTCIAHNAQCCRPNTNKSTPQSQYPNLRL